MYHQNLYDLTITTYLSPRLIINSLAMLCDIFTQKAYSGQLHSFLLHLSTIQLSTYLNPSKSKAKKHFIYIAKKSINIPKLFLSLYVLTLGWNRATWLWWWFIGIGRRRWAWKGTWTSKPPAVSMPRCRIVTRTKGYYFSDLPNSFGGPLPKYHGWSGSNVLRRTDKSECDPGLFIKAQWFLLQTNRFCYTAVLTREMTDIYL